MMGAHNYDDLRSHIGHRIVCVGYCAEEPTPEAYDGPDNVAVECEDCGVVLLDFDKQEEV
jgi:hypothetical protein